MGSARHACDKKRPFCLSRCHKDEITRFKSIGFGTLPAYCSQIATDNMKLVLIACVLFVSLEAKGLNVQQRVNFGSLNSDLDEEWLLFKKTHNKNYKPYEDLDR